MTRSKRRKFVPFLVVGVLASVPVVYFATRAPTTTTRLGTATIQDIIQRVTLAGNIEPVRTSNIAAPYEGYIQKLYVHLGQQVEKGQPLVSIVQSLNSNEEAFPIRSPFKGTVVQLPKTQGQYVKPSADLKDYILRVDDTSRLFVSANAPEIDIVKVRVGQKTDIKASAILNQNYEGVVREISLAATPREQWGSRSQIEYQVKIEVTNPDSLLKPGMSCLIDIVTQQKKKVLALPHEFIHLDGENPYVLLPDGKKLPVKLGIQNESVSEVLEGLGEGTQVKQVDFLSKENS